MLKFSNKSALKRELVKPINAIDIVCHQYLTILYHNIHGHGVNNRQSKNIAEAYGEILYPSVDRLVDELKLSEQDVFLDLGSGLGKVVIQVFLKSEVKEACGVEIIPELHQKSKMAAEKMKHDLPDFFTGGRKLTFVLGSFLEIPINTATAVLIGSPCFSQSMLYDLAMIIDNIPSIHSILSLRPLTNVKRFSFKKVIRIECSWDSTLCYVYKANYLIK